MIDVSVLKGAEVRSRGGSHGLLDFASPSRVRLRWEDADGTVRFESCLRSDARMGQIDVKLMNTGWTSLNSILGMEENVDAISKLTDALRESLDGELSERGQHWPYKNKDTLGKTGVPKYGPPPSKTRSVSKTDDWVCKKKGKYTQLCKGPDGRKKIVKINKAYKKKYNKAYRLWLSKKKKK